MRRSAITSSPVSVQDTPSSLISKSTPNTAVGSDKKTVNEDLAAAVASLTITTDRANDVRGSDPFLDAPVQARGSGLSPVAPSFDPNAIYGPVEILVELPAQQVSNVMGSFGAFTSAEGQAKRAIRVISTSSNTHRSLNGRVTHALKKAHIRPASLEDRVNMEECMITFDNTATAQDAFEILRDNIPDINVSYMTPKQVANFRGFAGSVISNHDGELIVTVEWNEQSVNFSPYRMLVMALVQKLAAPKACLQLAGSMLAAKQYLVEFANITTTTIALSIGKLVFKDFTITFQRFEPDRFEDTVLSTPTSMIGPLTPVTPQVSATGRSLLPPGTPYRSRQGYTSHFGRGGRRSDYLNSIDVQTIRLGGDCRTTVMLRNIPNRVNCHELKAYLDETSFGCYDFMYLRIDFANRCNVGYAFINFNNPQDIVEFALARQGRRWLMFNSDKKAEISYATIQGRENLITKFRNSSVMTETEDYRPKLFTPGSGVEEEFPESDNGWKMRRSMENAQTMGLWTRVHDTFESHLPTAGTFGVRRGRVGIFAPPAQIYTPPPTPPRPVTLAAWSEPAPRNFGPVGHGRSLRTPGEQVYAQAYGTWSPTLRNPFDPRR